MLTQTEENYLKTLFGIIADNYPRLQAGTNELACKLSLKPATVNDMLKKLKDKNLVSYEKYGKISLTETGNKFALLVIRKHRLWETFLYDKLEFTWDEVHEVAEQLEHVNSDKLVDRLDKFLEFPKFDPHGDPIPNSNGTIIVEKRIALNQVEIGEYCLVVSVKDNSNLFLQHAMKLGLKINSKILVLSIQLYDDLMQIEINEEKHTISKKFSDNILVCLIN
ncbi:MAG: metal-dependent transcriptional regulator [Solirubrobacteraceae bacterium]